MEDPTTWGRFLGVRSSVKDNDDGSRSLTYDMAEFLESCLDRYTQLTSVQKFRKVATPFLDEKVFEEGDFTTQGVLADCAASILMKLLWAARMVRWDLLRQTCNACVRQAFVSPYVLGSLIIGLSIVSYSGR